MQPKARQQLAIHTGQALALCWLLQQPHGAGGEVLAGLTGTLAFSRPLSGTERAMLPLVDPDRAEWPELFGEPLLASAALDRLT